MLKIKHCIFFSLSVKKEMTTKRSIGEKFVARILDEYCVFYYQDYSFPDLKGVKNGYLRFDFCIPIRKQTSDGFEESYVSIEYNGIFHYHVIEGKTTMFTLAKQQMNDLIKTDYCKRKCLPLLWIPYWLNAKQVRKSIEEFLKKHVIVSNTGGCYG
mgnify:CR=1 FL=1